MGAHTIRKAGNVLISKFIHHNLSYQTNIILKEEAPLFSLWALRLAWDRKQLAFIILLHSTFLG